MQLNIPSHINRLLIAELPMITETNRARLSDSVS